MNLPSPPQQTRSYLLRRLDEVGLRPKTKYGQNFLIDLNLLRLLADTAQLDGRDVALEVGCGTGGLTSLLAQRAAQVVAVEVDWQIVQLAREELARQSNVELLVLDALKNKNHLHPSLIEAVQRALAAVPSRRLKLVANLPYNIATPILTNLLAGPLAPYSMTVTIQKELADRLVALPGTKDYGALSVWIQSQCRAEIVRIMPPTVFWPRPKVHSAIVHLVVDPDLQARIPDREFFHQFGRLIFCHRRKFLRGELLSAYKSRLEKAAIDRALALCGHSGTERAEQLTVEQLLALSEAIRDELKRSER